MKIWRYVDLAKFVSMMATGTLYFPCATTELTDPYEGWLPRSHMKAFDQVMHATFTQFSVQHRALLGGVADSAQPMPDMQKLLREVNAKFGVNCWHINEGESEAMWQLYTAAGQGIAIESTRSRLENALQGDGIIVDRVRYMDFDRDEIDKGHRHYGLFIKRKSFAHEEELRATILLPEPGRGIAVPCDMNTLIGKIYIFPKAPSYYVEAVHYVIEHSPTNITAAVEPSKLLDPPDY